MEIKIPLLIVSKLEMQLKVYIAGGRVPEPLLSLLKALKTAQPTSTTLALHPCGRGQTQMHVLHGQADSKEERLGPGGEKWETNGEAVVEAVVEVFLRGNLKCGSPCPSHGLEIA